MTPYAIRVLAEELWRNLEGKITPISPVKYLEIALTLAAKKGYRAIETEAEIEP